jgi:flagellar biogenesis protein FliO
MYLGTPKKGSKPSLSLFVFALAGLIVGVWAALSGQGFSATPQAAVAAHDTGPHARLAESPALTEVTRPPAFDRWQTTAGLTLLAASGMAFWMVRRREQSDKSLHALNVVSQVKLGGRWQVSLVEVPGRLLVVGTTDKGVTLLTELTPDGAPAPRAEPTPVDTVRSPEFAPDGPIMHDLEDSETRRRRILAALPPSKVDTLFAGHSPDEDEPFLDHLMSRLNGARPSVFSGEGGEPPTAPMATAGVDERSAIRYRIQQYRRGPARL